MWRLTGGLCSSGAGVWRGIPAGGGPKSRAGVGWWLGLGSELGFPVGNWFFRQSAIARGHEVLASRLRVGLRPPFVCRHRRPGVRSPLRLLLRYSKPADVSILFALPPHTHHTARTRRVRAPYSARPQRVTLHTPSSAWSHTCVASCFPLDESSP